MEILTLFVFAAMALMILGTYSDDKASKRKPHHVQIYQFGTASSYNSGEEPGSATAYASSATDYSTPTKEEPAARDTSKDLRLHTVRYSDGTTRTVFSEADAKALTTWGGASSYKGAGDFFETGGQSNFSKNPFLDD